MRPPTTSPTTMKREFLKKWVLGLRMCSSTKVNKESSVLERKKAIKLSADVAMASMRSPSTLWSRSLISNAVVSDPDSSPVLERILGRKLITNTRKFSPAGSQLRSRRRMVKRKRKTMMKKKNKKKENTRSVARRMVKKRTEVLRRLVPGGEGMEECTLIREALDYMLSLRAQVDVMHHLTSATTHIFNSIPK